MRFVPWGHPMEGDAHVPTVDRCIPDEELEVRITNHPTINMVLVQVEPFDLRVGAPFTGVIAGIERRAVVER